MKKFLATSLLLFIMIISIGCNLEEPKIIIEDTIKVYLDEEFIVEPDLEGVKDDVKLVYSSNDEEVFIIDDNKIVPVSAGSASLFISIDNTEVKKEVYVYILEREFELSFFNTNFEILRGEDLALLLLANEEEVSGEVEWKSSNLNVASVDSNGVVNGINPGTTIITATYRGKKIETEIKVSNTKKVGNNDITVSGVKILEIGEFTLLTATTSITPATFKWTSDNEEVATINNGVIEGKAKGIATITVELVEDSSISYSFDVFVVNPTLVVTISPSTEMVVGDKENIIAVKNTRGIAISRHNCEIKSLNEDIAIVDEDGRVIAKGVGKTTIEVKYQNAIGTIEIIVNEAPVINYRNLILQIAIGENGYIEGYNNDTKYGDWYGMPNQPWCAMFVSWCADQAGIPNTIIPKYAAVASGLAWYQAKGSDYYRSYEETQTGEYVPVAGDIVFFKSNGASHTALVIKVEGDIMYTIEGNTSNRVALRYYHYKNYDKITGYGLPNYQASSTPIKDFDVTLATFGGGVPTT